MNIRTFSLLAFTTSSLLLGCVSAPQPTLDADQFRYSNYQHGFEIDHPIFIQVFDGSRIADPDSQLTYLPICDAEKAVTCLYYPRTEFDHSNFEGAGLSINYLADKNTPEQCAVLYDAVPGSPSLTKQKIINGIPFLFETTSNAGAGHQMEEMTYRTMHENQCVEITVRLGTTSYENYPEGSIAKFTDTDREHVRTILNAMLQSFRFTR